MWRRRNTGVGAAGDDGVNRARELGWKVHGSQESWTGKVDGKASFVLALEVVALSALVIGTGFGTRLHDLAAWRGALVRVAAAVTLLAVALAAGTVFPMLGSRRAHARDHSNNMIYFGHLRHWKTPEALADRMVAMTPRGEVDQLARQVIAMSRGNWRKHVLLRWALVSGVVGLVLVVVAALWP